MPELLDTVFNLGNQDTLESILSRLLTKEDIELKTNIPNPLALTQMKLIADYCEESGLPKTAKVINSFITHFTQYQVSKDGERASQIVRAFSDVVKIQTMNAQKKDILGRDKEII